MTTDNKQSEQHDEQQDTALVRVESREIVISDQDLAIIGNALLDGKCTPAELKFLRLQCINMGLDVFKKEVHFWRDPKTGRIVTQVGVSGWYRRMREHPLFQRGHGPEFCGKDGKWMELWVPQQGQPQPYAGRYGIKRKDDDEIIWEISYFAEKYQANKPAWQQNPLSLFGDRCVAAACRRVLADSFGGLYMEGELPEAQEEAQKLRNSMAMSEFAEQQAEKAVAVATEPQIEDADFEEINDGDTGSAGDGSSAAPAGVDSGPAGVDVPLVVQPGDPDWLGPPPDTSGVESDVRGKDLF